MRLAVVMSAFMKLDFVDDNEDTIVQKKTSAAIWYFQNDLVIGVVSLQRLNCELRHCIDHIFKRNSLRVVLIPSWRFSESSKVVYN